MKFASKTHSGPIWLTICIITFIAVESKPLMKHSTEGDKNGTHEIEAAVYITSMAKDLPTKINEKKTPSKRHRNRKGQKHDRKQHTGVPKEEMAEFMSQVVEGIENSKTQCPADSYYNVGLKTCEPCTKCVSDTDLTHCGIVCRGHFRENRLQNGLNKRSTHSYINTVVMSSLIAIVIYFAIALSEVKKTNAEISKRLKDMENRSRAPPTCDGNATRHPTQPTEQTAFMGPGQED